MGGRVYFFHNVWGQIRAIEYPEEIQHGILGKLGESHFRTQQISLHFFLGHLLGHLWDDQRVTSRAFLFFLWDWGNPLVSDTVAYMALLSKHEQNPRITWALALDILDSGCHIQSPKSHHETSWNSNVGSWEIPENPVIPGPVDIPDLADLRSSRTSFGSTRSMPWTSPAPRKAVGCVKRA